MTNEDLSKTMVIPNPGGRRNQPILGHESKNNSDDYFSSTKRENKILEACNEIIALASNLKSLEPEHPIEQLKIDINNLILKFVSALEDQRAGQEVVLTSRYIICCLIDELILSTPWGQESSWNQQTLLSKYHNETWGGEKFFLIIDKLLENPKKNIELLELCYICLSLGFSGKYKLSEQGTNQLLSISHSIYTHIEQLRPIPRDLSPKWQGEGPLNQSFVKRFPMWITPLIILFVLAATYIGLLSNLQTKADPVYQSLENIGWDDFVLQLNKKSNLVNIEQIANDLRQKLSWEIQQKQLEIEVNDSMITIRFISEGLFKSGSSQIDPASLPDVNKFIIAIKEYAERIIIIGHTDSTGKADSNWVISRKRAEAISSWLELSNYSLSGVITRGVADTQPLYPNDTARNRSLNRRVELLLVLKGVQ